MVAKEIAAIPIRIIRDGVFLTVTRCRCGVTVTCNGFLAHLIGAINYSDRQRTLRPSSENAVLRVLGERGNANRALQIRE